MIVKSFAVWCSVCSRQPADLTRLVQMTDDVVVVAIERGVQLLSYPRHEFEPAGSLGFMPPFPIPPKDEEDWMVRARQTGLIGSVHGRVLCADALNRPEYWRD